MSSEISSEKEIKTDKQEILIGEPVLTKFERARIVGARALQISHGAPELINVEESDMRPIDVAQKELKARVLPVGMARRLPNRDYQIIPIHWLEDREFISQIDAQEIAAKKKKKKN